MSPGPALDAVVLGIDIGTTNAKGVACRPDGTIVARARRAHAVDRPASGHVEHDAETVWWGDTVALCRELVAAVGDAARIRAIAITTCGPCLVPVDDGGRPLRAGILYGVDTRATAEINHLERRIGGPAIRRAGRLSLTSQSVGPKIAWVARHEPAIARRTRTWHTATSFIVERLSGVAAIDHHQASYFGPYIDARRRTWDLRFADAVERAALDGRLPPRRWPGQVAGPITAAASLATGLPAGTPVLVGTSDGPMEALAAGATRSGIVAITHGSTTTLTTLGLPSGRPRGLWLTEGLVEDRPCIGAGLTTTGSLLRWAAELLAPGLAPEAAADVLAREAADAPAGARGLVVVPSFAGEGLISGLDLEHTRGDLYRGLLEGIAFGVRQVLETFAAAGIPVERLHAAGGGTQHPLALQIVSDVTGHPQAVAAEPVGAALGAARLAAETVGLTDADADWFVADRHILPDPTTSAVYDASYRSFRRLAHDS